MPLKLQWVEPDTCEKPSCRYLELWNTDDPPLARIHKISAFERQCTAHADPNIPIGVMLWEDGNWKNLEDYIKYQRRWFLHKNYKDWKIKYPDKGVPSSLKRSATEPTTSGTINSPKKKEYDAMEIAYAINKENNMRKNSTVQAARMKDAERDDISWYWTGTGDTRILHEVIPTLSVQDRNDLQSIADIQFGTNKVIIEG